MIAAAWTQAEGEGGGEAGAEDGEGAAERVDADRPVEVADVEVGLVPPSAIVAAVVSSCPASTEGTPHLRQLSAGQHGEEQGEAGDRAGVGAGSEPSRACGAPRAAARRPRSLAGVRDGDAHAEAGRTAPTSRRICPGASRRVSEP